jgi:hypothetical protein
MSIPDRIKAKPHMFMPGQTVQGAVKQYNLYDTTKEEIIELMAQFNKINDNAIPKPGMNMMIPILSRHCETVFGQK